MAEIQELAKFVVWAPDSTDVGTLEKRLAVRPSHLDNAHRLTKEGILRKPSAYEKSWSDGDLMEHTGVGGGVLTAGFCQRSPR
ncbi:hypothetical protein J3R82DRAFT_10453 [Butyriboletus roseoflavus]|nr:hypothetical protein J3R82DRAFT_10453 [Butyriboletus roseoflavus]